MALHYQYYGIEDTTKWTPEDWEIYNSLIWLTLGVDIGYLCEKSADEFIRRSNILRLTTKDIHKEMLVKFYGLKTNVTTLTASQWAKKHFTGKHFKADAVWVKGIERAIREGYKKDV